MDELLLSWIIAYITVMGIILFVFLLIWLSYRLDESILNAHKRKNTMYKLKKVVPSCSFCQGDNAIFHGDSYSLFIDSQGNLEVFIPELSVPAASVKVKFCPMCGREFSE